MNSSELLRRRQEAANQYKSHWKARDASEVVQRNNLVANNNIVRSNYRPVVPYSGTTVVGGGTSNIGRRECDVAQGPGNGFTRDLSYDTILNANAACHVCTDPNWSTSGGISLQTCASVSNILEASPANPMAGLRWINASNMALQGSCPPNNSAQTPHFVSDPKCLTTYYPPVFDKCNVYYGSYTPKNKQRA